MFYETTWRHIPEDGTLHSHRCDNHQSHIYDVVYQFVLAEEVVDVSEEPTASTSITYI
jgi:hypothetical protein